MSGLSEDGLVPRVCRWLGGVHADSVRPAGEVGRVDALARRGHCVAVETGPCDLHPSADRCAASDEGLVAGDVSGGGAEFCDGAGGFGCVAESGGGGVPMRDGLETIVGIRLRNERGKFAVRGSRQGIFTTTMKPQPTMYVCEGPTDTAAAVDLGLFAVGRPNCCCGGADIREFCRRHAVRRVVMLSDNDKPGLDGARKVGLEIGLLFAVYVPPAKDLRAYLRLGGTSELIANTLRHTVWSQP